ARSNACASSRPAAWPGAPGVAWRTSDERTQYIRPHDIAARDIGPIPATPLLADGAAAARIRFAGRDLLVPARRRRSIENPFRLDRSPRAANHAAAAAGSAR